MVRMLLAMAARSTSAHARSAVVSDDGASGVTTSRGRAVARSRGRGVALSRSRVFAGVLPGPLPVRLRLMVIPLPIVSTHGDGALLCDVLQRR